MGKMATIRDVVQFLSERKRWWLVPALLVLLLMGAVIVITEGTAVAPFIYTLF